MARFDELRRELGLLPPLQRYDDIGTVTASMQKWASQPSPLAKALAGLEARMAKALRHTAKPAARHIVVDPKAAARAKLARAKKQTDAMIRAGKLTAHETAVLEVHLNDFGARYCQ